METQTSPDASQAPESFFTRQDEPVRGSQPRAAESRTLAPEPAREPEPTPEAPEAAPQEKSIEQKAREAGVSVGEMQRRELQSERDKLRSEVEKLREGEKTFQEKMTEMEAASRLLEFSQQDPAFLQHLNAYFDPSSNGRQPAQSPTAGGVQAEALPEAPVPPEQPATYSEYDAYNDPDSESWKYRQALQKYEREDRAYLRRMIEHDRTEREAAQRAVEQDQQKRAYMDSVIQRGVAKHGIPADEQRAYRQMLETLTPEKEEEIFAFYFQQQGRPSVRETLASEKAKALEREAALRREVSAASVATPAAPEPVEDSFFRRSARTRSLTG